jgi:hypothetical protein
MISLPSRSFTTFPQKSHANMLSRFPLLPFPEICGTPSVDIEAKFRCHRVFLGKPFFMKRVILALKYVELKVQTVLRLNVLRQHFPKYVPRN